MMIMFYCNRIASLFHSNVVLCLLLFLLRIRVQGEIFSSTAQLRLLTEVEEAWQTAIHGHKHTNRSVSLTITCNHHALLILKELM